MLGIIGLILKIILWVILGVLGLVILLLNIILWVPIRYRVDVSKPADGDLSVKGRVTWILRLIRVYFTYDKDVKYKAKLLFFTVADSESEEVSSDETDETDETDESDISSEKKEALGTEDSQYKTWDKYPENKREVDAFAPVDHDIKQDVNKKDVELDDTASEDQASSTLNKSSQSTVQQAGESPSIDIKIDESDSKQVNNITNNTDDTVTESSEEETDKAKEVDTKKTKKKSSKKAKSKKEGSPLDGVKAAYEKYSPLWKDERYEGVFKFVLSNVLKILKSILPKKLRADVTFGLDDPATTGYIVGGISMFYGLVGDSIKVRPDFHEKGFEGEIFAKGRVFLGVLLYYVIRTYLDKRVRAVIKMFRS